ncbi:hypothetical protein SPI_04994 [Niveomyces insectorum RCEF 264]|uniref:Uncharacterized protein n=1 Tax=Niveomyces insectorum RCEF 264 TaxID=1081102 RepID=A0A167TUT7_9HYPO|nr:hypothetical protein SPI_04994 [Niveomyces insectorum RCEF 264]
MALADSSVKTTLPGEARFVLLVNDVQMWTVLLKMLSDSDQDHIVCLLTPVIEPVESPTPTTPATTTTTTTLHAIDVFAVLDRPAKGGAAQNASAYATSGTVTQSTDDDDGDDDDDDEVTDFEDVDEAISDEHSVTCSTNKD